MKHRPIFLILLICLCLTAAFACADGEVKVKDPGMIRPGRTVRFTVTAAEAGHLTLRITDVFTDLTLFDGPVEAGVTTVPWLGQKPGGEPFAAGKYTLEASLATAQGSFTERRTVSVGSSAPSLQYVLPTSDVLYTGDDTWLIDYLLMSEGTVVITLTAVSDPDTVLKTWYLPGSDSAPRVFRWNGLLGRKAAEEGEYNLHFAVRENRESFADVRLTIRHGQAPEAAMHLSGLYLPDPEAEDSIIWEALMQPVTVVDIISTNHQKIYAGPSESSAVLGTMHGQSQGLLMLETGVSGFARVGVWRHEDGRYIEGYVPEKKLKTVRPNQHWGVVIDKQHQRLTVYRDGAKVGSVPISTGKAARDKLFRETQAGACLTLDRQSYFSSEGYTYHYAIRISGGNLIHSVGEQRKSGKPDFTDHLAQLGVKASHGCIRVSTVADDDGIDIWYLWTHLPRYTKVLVTDDPEERAYSLALCGGQPDAFTPPADRVAAPRQTADPFLEDAGEAFPGLDSYPGSILLTFGGDTLIASEDQYRALPESFDSFVAREGFAYPLSGLAELFEKDDLTTLNLECVLRDVSKDKREGAMYNFRGPREFVQILTASSVEHVNIANNHHGDYGQTGRNITRETLEGADVAYSGYGSLYVHEKNGYRIGFGGIRETTWLQDPEQAVRDIRELQQRGCDFIVYACHFGTEYETQHNALQETMAHAIIDAGADVIIGHHPHVVQGIETYRGRLIFYSLGNLCFGGNLNPTDYDGLVVQLLLTPIGEEQPMITVRLIPIETSGVRDGTTDFRPVYAEGADRARILRRIAEDSNFDLTSTFETGAVSFLVVDDED